MFDLSERLAKIQFGWGVKIYPSGEFVLFRKAKTDVKREIKSTNIAAHEGLARAGTDGAMYCVLPTFSDVQYDRDKWKEGLPALRSVEAGPTDATVLMGLSALANSKKKRRGLGGLTSHGKNMVREAAWGMQEFMGMKRLSFWTCTLPPLEESDLRRVCENWSAILNNLRQKLVYHLSEAGLPPHVVGVTELQPERWAQEGFPGWHIHWLFVGRHWNSGWAISTELSDKLWGEAVSVYCSREYDWSGACKIEGIWRSASGYLAKYMSKGSRVASEVEEKYPGCVPSSWYTCTASLRDWVKHCTVRSVEAARWVHQVIVDNIDAVIAPWPFMLPTRDGMQVAVCWLGRLAHPPSPLVPLPPH